MIQSDVRSKRGFTAVELVLAVVVIGIIVSVTLVYMKKSDRSRITTLSAYSPGEVFKASGKFVDNESLPDGTIEVVVTVTNPTRHSLPLLYHPLSFLLTSDSKASVLGTETQMKILVSPGEHVGDTYLRVVKFAPWSSVDFHLTADLDPESSVSLPIRIEFQANKHYPSHVAPFPMSKQSLGSIHVTIDE